MTRASASHPAGSAGEAAVVLVVDDDAGYRQLIRWALEDNGLAVETAADVPRALESAARRPPSLAVVDVVLPGGGGIVLAEDLRRLCDEGFPIVTITADDHAEQKGRLMGAQAWLHKPFDIDDLVRTVRRVLTSGR